MAVKVMAMPLALPASAGGTELLMWRPLAEKQVVAQMPRRPMAPRSRAQNRLLLKRK